MKLEVQGGAGRRMQRKRVRGVEEGCFNRGAGREGKGGDRESAARSSLHVQRPSLLWKEVGTEKSKDGLLYSQLWA